MDEKGFLSQLRAKGFQGGTLPIGRVRDIEKDIDSLRQQGRLDGYLEETYFNNWRFRAPEDFPQARSIVIVAAPQAKLRISFQWHGQEVFTVVPPTYARATQTTEQVRTALKSSARPAPARFERALLPLKTVATRCGLARYGRNNITYVPGQGSYHRLTGFYTDLDFGTDHWQEREMLPSCDHCRRCLEACPTGVIEEERFQVQIERCLTFLNEMPAERMFSTAVRKEWHNAIVGCMLCQDSCPQNRAVQGRVEQGERFDEKETAYLLQGDFRGAEAKALGEKLERCGLDLTTFPRNLRAILPS